MASHSHHPSDAVSAARITAYCGVVAALITTIGAIIVVNHNSINFKEPPTAAITPTPTATSLPGAPNTELRFSPLINGKLTVSGSAPKDVNGMFVIIGPRSSPGRYDMGCGNVVNQRWQTEITTDTSWPNYPLVTQASYGSCPVVTSERAFKFTFHGTETTPLPPPSPDQILDCVKQNGPSCLNGPGFLPPTTYQPNQ